METVKWEKGGRRQCFLPETEFTDERFEPVDAWS